MPVSNKYTFGQKVEMANAEHEALYNSNTKRYNKLSSSSDSGEDAIDDTSAPISYSESFKGDGSIIRIN